MKKSLCFYFQIHLPFQFRRYRFFDIGNSHQYYDDFDTRTALQKAVEHCYLPMNRVLMDIIKEHGKNFKVAFSITGETIEQFELYAPQVLNSFKELAATGSVEFLCETYSHSLVFLKDEHEFDRQLLKQAETIERYFGQKPSVVRLTGLIYSDQIGERVAKLGFKAMVAEGAKHVLGWKTPNYLYSNAYNSKFKILLRNFRLSDDIAYRFSDRSWDQWPVTCEKFTGWLHNVDKTEEVVNLFMDYLTFGERHSKGSGIFEFMRYLPQDVLNQGEFEFLTPSEVVKKHEAKAPVHVPYPISWSEEERDLSIWLGNDLQNDAFNSLSELGTKVSFVDDTEITRDWERLQDSDNYYYMGTKWMTEGTTRRFKNVYSSPYDAYINYMNILSDFTLRVEELLDIKIKELLANKKYTERLEDIVSANQNKYTSIQVKKIINILGDELGLGLLKKAKKSAKPDKSQTKEAKTTLNKTSKVKKN